MAKKRASARKPNTIKRTTTMANTLKDGEKFLADTQKKKSTRTRTMAQTIKEGKQILAKKPAKNKRQNKRDDSRSESVVPKNQKKKQKKITKKKAAANKSKKGSKTKANSQPAKSTTASKKGIRRSKPAVPSVPGVPVAANVARTIFKTKSKDHLPLPAFGYIDICFCIDSTGSMSGELAQAQSTIVSIIHNIENKVQTEGLTLRFAVCSYRDHPPQQSTYVINSLDFTSQEQAIKYVKNLQAYGGGDFPEAVHDGLLNCCTNLNWIQIPGTPVLRYIFHIADAPPHGSQFGNGHQKQGCTCGIQTSQVIHEMNIRQIHYRLIKARSNAQLTQMEEIFKKGVVNFDSTQLSHANQMDVKVSDMIIHQVVPI